MTITASVIADSISPEGIRLTTFQLRYPRFIHSELMTHRTFSRNASSSRAIPVNRMIEDLRRDPAMPIYWGSNKPGMQAGEELTGEELNLAKEIWLYGMEDAIGRAQALINMSLHKQIANRILEPWAHINVVVTATDYENFFALRRHADAQPEIKALADAMWEAREASTPAHLRPGDWHLPFITSGDYGGDTWNSKHPQLDYLKKISVARCARVSYLTHDGKKSTVEEDLKLYDRLLGSMPLHCSPAEHQATPDTVFDNPHNDPIGSWSYENPELHGNLRGWCQHRKFLDGEFVAG